MSTEVIEGTAIEVVPPERAIVPVQPGQALVAAETPTGPAEMIAKATALADALSAMVSKQKLYTEIRGKKYPHVEAWQTIGRMDNVVARESQPPIRHEDGSYEAFVELIRLSDGMVIGGASALCGTKDDVNGRQDWSKQSEPSRRSMAATRATSRAFRGQYAWIMALAGYQPTPADEMPGEPDPPSRPLGQHDTPPDRPQLQRTTHADGLTGNADLGKDGGTSSGTDYQLRIEKERGHVIGFRLTMGRKGYKVLAFGQFAEALSTQHIIGERVTCWGTMHDESFVKDGKTITYQIMHLERIQTPDGVLPGLTEPPTSSDEPVEAPSVPLFDDADMASLDRETGAA